MCNVILRFMISSGDPKCRIIHRGRTEGDGFVEDHLLEKPEPKKDLKSERLGPGPPKIELRRSKQGPYYSKIPFEKGLTI